jgi:hypothetical protein
MKKFLAALLLLASFSLFAYPDHIDEYVFFDFNPELMKLEEFIENEVGISNLSFSQADFLYDLNAYECEGSNPAPMPFFGSWTCGSGNDFVPVGPDTLMNVGILGIDEICGSDFTLSVGMKLDDTYVADLFVADFEPVYDQVWSPFLHRYITIIIGYQAPAAVFGGVGVMSGELLATELHDILELGGASYPIVYDQCVYNF